MTPVGIVNMPGPGPVSFSTARTVMELNSVRRAMSSANFSIDAPALTWRRFDWLSMSFYKGMSREALRVIFFFLAIGITPRLVSREPLSGTLNPSWKTRPASCFETRPLYDHMDLKSIPYDPILADVLVRSAKWKTSFWNVPHRIGRGSL
jgi:hypothetical protein